MFLYNCPFRTSPIVYYSNKLFWIDESNTVVVGDMQCNYTSSVAPEFHNVTTFTLANPSMQQYPGNYLKLFQKSFFYLVCPLSFIFLCSLCLICFSLILSLWLSLSRSRSLSVSLSRSFFLSAFVSLSYCLSLSLSLSLSLPL